MFKIIRVSVYKELNQQLDGLRSVNDEKTARIDVLEGFTKSLEMERETLRNANTTFRETVKSLEGKVSDFKSEKAKFRERIENFRVEAKTSQDRAIADKARIEELQTELKLAKIKANSLAEQSLKDKETIQNLRNDIALDIEEIAGMKNLIAELKEKVEIYKSKTAPTPPTTPSEIPNRLEGVKVLAASTSNTLDGEVINVQKSQQPGPISTVVGNVKRPYRKTGKFKRK